MRDLADNSEKREVVDDDNKEQCIEYLFMVERKSRART
jgi:hypothetical protein